MINIEKILKNLSDFSNKENIKYKTLIKEFLVIMTLDIIADEKNSDHLILKGGSALSLFYGSNRFSSDIDLDLYLNFSVDEENSVELCRKLLEDLKEKKKFKHKYSGITCEFEFSDLKKDKIKGNVRFYFLDKKENVGLDISFQNKGFGKRMKILDDKRNFYLIGESKDIKFKVMNEESILIQKIITFGDRVKGSDIYDINFLLNKGVTFEKEDILEIAIDDYRENRDHIFYGIKEDEIEEVFLNRIEFIQKISQNSFIDIFKDVNEGLSSSNKIIDTGEFLNDFYENVKSIFRNIELLEHFDLIEDEEKEHKKGFSKENLRKSLIGFNKHQLKSGTSIELNNGITIAIKDKKYLLNGDIYFNDKYSLIEHVYSSYSNKY